MNSIGAIGVNHWDRRKRNDGFQILLQQEIYCFDLPNMKASNNLWFRYCFLSLQNL